MKIIKLLGAVAVLSLPLLAGAQTAPPYGPPITLDQAKKAVAAAQAEARKNKWDVVVAIVDPAGQLVLLEKMDNTQNAASEVARQKASSAALYRRPTKAFQDGLAAGGAGLRILRLEGAVPLDGGLPIVVDGKIIGAIGVSGVMSEQDGQIAKAGVDALLK
ncbi:MAG: GlcG/HbpS family heme-binding protein [Candidatus Methylomirabilales bacterium]